MDLSAYDVLKGLLLVGEHIRAALHHLNGVPLLELFN